MLVSRLRGTLGADRIPRHDAGYALVADWLDLQELEEGVAAAERAVAAADALSARLAATMALDLVRGPLRAGGERAVVRRPAAGDGADGRRHPPARRRGGAGVGRPGRCRRAGGSRPRPRPLRRGGAPLADAGARRARSAGVGAGRLRRRAGAPGRGPRRVARRPRPRRCTRRSSWRAPSRHRWPTAAPAAPERWDPLVQRARAELAGHGLRRAPGETPSEAVRRGAGAGALELAGWVAYYDRDFPSALRLAEEAARTARRRRATHERADPVRTGPALAGRPGRRRARPRGRACRAPSPASGAPARCGWATCACTRAGSTRPSSCRRAAPSTPPPCATRSSSRTRCGPASTRSGALGRVDGDPRRAGVARHDPRRARARPAIASVRCVDNFWGWILGAIGRTDEAHERHRRAVDPAGRFTEPLHHALFDLALAAVEAEDAATARGLARPGRGAARRRRRHGVAPAPPPAPPRGAGWRCIEGDRRGRRARRATWVRDDAGAPRRGPSRRPGRGRAAPGGGDDRLGRRRGVDATVASLDELARLEAWRLTARLAAATGRRRPLGGRRALRRAARRRLRSRRRPRPRLDPDRAHRLRLEASDSTTLLLTDVVRSWR